MKYSKKIHANEIVGSVKSYNQFFADKFLNLDDIDFLGCSELYVEEKINELIYWLQHMKKVMRTIEKQQILRAKELKPIKSNKFN